MRTSLSFLLPVIAMVACSTGDSTRTIEAHIGGGGGKMLYFDRSKGNQQVHVDSVKLDADGKGTFKLPYMPLDLYTISLSNTDRLFLILDSAENVKLEATAGNLEEPTRVEGSYHSDLMYGFMRESKQLDQKKQALVKRINVDRYDTAAIQEINQLNREFPAMCKSFVEQHKSSPAVLVAIGRLEIQKEMSLYLQVRDSLRKVMPRSEYFIGFRDAVDRANQQLAAQQAQDQLAAQMDQLIPVGGPAPDFAQPTPEGKSLSLSSLRGKVVLIDFWASWCGPCRRENPNVKKVYAEYRNKGFEILGVSLDKSKEAWLGAIAQDGLPWKHVSDLGFWNNAAAQQYGVSSIPYTVLVDRNGNVLAKNLRGPALEQKLAEVFNN